MKIAFVAPVNGLSGGLFVVYRHAHHLAAQGHDVEILFASGASGVLVRHYPNFALRTRLLEHAVNDGSDYDVVFATWWTTFYGLFHLKAKHRLYFCQSDERRYYPPADPQWSLANVTYGEPGVGYLTESQWIRTWLKKDYGIDAAYAPNGVDRAMFHPGVKPLEPKTKRTRILIEGPGGIPFKRVDQAFRVAWQFPECELWYVSTDNVADPTWSCDRTFTQVPFEQMPAIYASCDILLKLSVVEGFVGPPLEMMACGQGACVVAKATGWEEYMKHEENALLVDLDDVEGAVRSVRRLLDDQALRDRLVANGLKTADALDWTRRLPEFERAVQALTSTPRSEIPVSRVDLYKAMWSMVSWNDRTEKSMANLREQQRSTLERLTVLENHLRNWVPYRMWMKLKGGGKAASTTHA